MGNGKTAGVGYLLRMLLVYPVVGAALACLYTLVADVIFSRRVYPEAGAFFYIGVWCIFLLLNVKSFWEKYEALSYD